MSISSPARMKMRLGGRSSFGTEAMSTYGVVLFYTTSAAMRAEKTLKKGSLTVKLIPTPRELSSDCGIALRFDWGQVENVENLLEAAHVEAAGVHQILCS